MKPWPVWVTLDSIPWAARTAFTWSGFTLGSSNRIVQTVPPVKSIANCSPYFGFTNPMRMKIRPGIVMASESAKNQRRLPMMSNTPARLSSDAGGRRAGQELRLGHAVQARLARPRLRDHDAEDRAGDRDRGEHRHQHADDQDEAEAADRRRPEQEQDQRR